jgi:hypothetical protein
VGDEAHHQRTHRRQFNDGLLQERGFFNRATASWALLQCHLNRVINRFRRHAKFSAMASASPGPFGHRFAFVWIEPKGCRPRRTAPLAQRFFQLR